MTRSNTIKTRADGSIDTAFYMARGRQMRSEQARGMARTATEPRRRGPILVAVLALFAWPFAG